MRIVTVSLLCGVLLTLHSCIGFGKRVDGNGNVTTETRQIALADNIKLTGGINVVVQRGQPGVKVETDENLQQYVLTDVDDGWLEIRSKDNMNLQPTREIKVYVTTPNVKNLKVTGSGNITCNDKFVSQDAMSFGITGSGDIVTNVNTPRVQAKITGSGNLRIEGETKDLEIGLTGSGNFIGPNLKSENASVKIAGSGDATFFADGKIDASVMGSGNVKYRGNPTVDSHVAGSGTIQKTND